MVIIVEFLFDCLNLLFFSFLDLIQMLYILFFEIQNLPAKLIFCLQFFLFLQSYMILVLIF